ncbi:ABC transporter arginine-binding protein 1-like [Glandiceps talaboti]
MMSQHVPLPMMRAMMMRRMSAGQASPFAPAMAGQQQPNQLLRSLVLFRILGEKMGKKIIDELENRITDNRVYTFASSLSCNCALEYVNDDGEMAGFNFDLVKAVCKQAGKKCETVYDASSNCYTHHSGEHSRGGIGLLAKHYDGCMSWMLTSEREHSVAFTHPYWDEGNDAHFYVKAGNPKGFDPTNIQTSHIGFVDGWASDKHCLKGHRDHIIGTEHLDDPNVTEYVDAREDLFNELKDEKIDAVFMLTSLAGQTNSLGFEAIGDALKCGSGHSHVMVRKDSHVPDWFDPALDNLKTSGKYYQVCRHAKEVHGHKGDIHCMYPGEN